MVQESWERGTVIENDRAKLVCDFEFNLRKTTTSWRPDLILEDKERKKTWICDMTCPQQRNIETKRLEKLTKYRQLAFDRKLISLIKFCHIIPFVMFKVNSDCF